jgi:hypothetical protein
MEAVIEVSTGSRDHRRADPIHSFKLRSVSGDVYNEHAEKK